MMLSIASPDAAPSHVAGEPFVMLVDDHEPTLRCLHEIVETAGHPCVATLSAAEALVYCDSLKPSVVVTDLAMPSLDGSCLARWLKARYPSVPILLVTGELLAPATVSSLERTFAAVLAKPLEIDAFLGLLGSLMKEQ